MPDFTEDEIQDARRHPIVGDIWMKTSRNTREVADVAHGSVRVRSSYIGRVFWITQRDHFRWTRNATLLRRGHFESGMTYEAALEYEEAVAKGEVPRG